MYMPGEVKVDVGKRREISNTVTERFQSCISDIARPIDNIKYGSIRYIYQLKLMLMLVSEVSFLRPPPTNLNPASVISEDL